MIHTPSYAEPYLGIRARRGWHDCARPPPGRTRLAGSLNEVIYQASQDRDVFVGGKGLGVGADVATKPGWRVAVVRCHGASGGVSKRVIYMFRGRNYQNQTTCKTRSTEDRHHEDAYYSTTVSTIQQSADSKNLQQSRNSASVCQVYQPNNDLGLVWANHAKQRPTTQKNAAVLGCTLPQEKQCISICNDLLLI